jgi:hypothetical protein
VDQPEQQVLGTNEVVIEQPGFLLSKDHHPAPLLSESLEHTTRLCPRRRDLQGVTLPPVRFPDDLNGPKGRERACTLLAAVVASFVTAVRI